MPGTTDDPARQRAWWLAPDEGGGNGTGAGGAAGAGGQQQGSGGQGGAAGQQGAGDDDDEELGEKGSKALAAERRARRAAETTARQREQELEQLRQTSMSDSEKAVAQAKAEGRREALATVNLERVKDKIEAAAGGKFADPEDAHHLLGDAAQFIDADGTINAKAIRKALEDLLKSKPYLAAGPRAGGSYDGGAGSSASGTTDMNAAIRSRMHR